MTDPRPAADAVETTTRTALTRVLESELARDVETVLIGETVRYTGAAGVTAGLYDRFGPRQVIETPVSENGILSAALGLALAGMRPIVEIYSADFLLAVASELVNDIAKWRQQHGRDGGLPICVRGCMGATGGLGPEHSQCVEAYFHHAPGLTVVAPGTPSDAVGLLRASIRSDEPVIFLEHRCLYDLPASPPMDDDFVLPIGETTVARDGHDATLVAWAWMRQEAEAAADALADEGIEIEIVDPRTIKPMGMAPIVESAKRTGRLVVAEESPTTGSVGAEILAAALEELSDRRVAAARVAMPDVIHPYSPTMEAAVLPRSEHIVATVRRLCRA